MLRLRAATFLAAYALAACSAGPAMPAVTQVAASHMSAPPATPVVTTTAPRATATQPLTTASPAAPATQVAQTGGVIQLDFGCAPDVARCQDMPAGTYETSGRFAFLPGLTVTLPAGWSSAEQDAGEFGLHRASDVESASAIFFWSDLVAWVDGAPRPDLGTSADEFADYLLGDARLTVVEGPSRTFRVRGPDSLAVVRTVQARSLSVIVSASAKSDADFPDCSGEAACVNVFIDPVHWPGAANLGRNIDAPAAGCPCSQVWRLYVASIGSELDPHTFVVAVETVGPIPLQALSAWEAQVEPIIASVLVPSIVVDN